MVKVSGPCLSLEASGSVGKAITFQKGLKSRTVRKCPVKKPTRTPGQETVRTVFSKAVTYWHALLTSQQTLWKEFIDGDGNSSFQAFMHQWIIRCNDGLPQYELPPYHGYCIVGEHLVGEFTVGGVWIDP